MGDVLIMARELDIDEQVTFRLKRFLGLKEVAVEGIRTYRF
ncbi:glycosidase [Eggerthella sp. YY7918]|nr:glycosidase [Eggerthella sp. YY7918]